MYNKLSRLPLTPEWHRLVAHQQVIEPLQMRDLFAADPQRFSRFSIELDGLLFDYSKNRITEETLPLLFKLARHRDLAGWIERLRSGEKINLSEERAVLHTALRHRLPEPVHVDGQDVMPDVRAVLARMRDFTQRVRSGEWRGFTGKPIRHIVNIGIGGSDLGPMLVSRALAPYAAPGQSSWFVSNVDGGQLTSVLHQCTPDETLFVICSKTFTTLETSMNAGSAKRWLLQHLPAEAVARHFVAVSTNQEAVTAFGIDPVNMFEFWDWVGGRYSVWSAVGLSVALQIGMDAFELFLEGGHAMDQHFFEAPFERNIPVIMAMLGIWYNTFFKAHTHAIMPYDHRLARLPSFLQQLDMESNGKRMNRYGELLEIDTGPVIWGEVGCNAQHAFFQLLHQGTRLVPSDFIVAVNPHHDLEHHHHALVANCLAQTEALMRGKTEDEALAELHAEGLKNDRIQALLPHKLFPGNQPSNTLMLSSLNPYTLGMLLALYEHKVFTQGVIWGINSFDQWGVEYGKQLAKRITPQLTKTDSPPEHDASTNGLIHWYQTHAYRNTH